MTMKYIVILLMYYNGGLAMINIVVVASTDICSNRENEVHNEVQ